MVTENERKGMGLNPPRARPGPQTDGFDPSAGHRTFTFTIPTPLPSPYLFVKNPQCFPSFPNLPSPRSKDISWNIRSVSHDFPPIELKKERERDRKRERERKRKGDRKREREGARKRKREKERKRNGTGGLTENHKARIIGDGNPKT